MFIVENDNEEIKHEVSKLLKTLGVKYRIKKSDYRVVPKVEGGHIFKTKLERLSHTQINIPQCSNFIEVPSFLFQACSFIERNITVEGLFRKAGSSSRQKELKMTLDNGELLHPESVHHVIDVANVLKLFLRELPEPLIPFKFHDTFLRCLMLKEKKVDAVLLTCLLMSKEYLNSLAFLANFLRRVALNCNSNKMDVGNLAIIMTPNIMPVTAPKMTPRGTLRINHHVQVVQILIEHATLIGVVPDCICEQLGLMYPSLSSSSHDELESSQHKKKRKKRRSGSLTRMLNGLKKMVGGKASPDSDIPTTPDQTGVPHTPCIKSTAKKRKVCDSFQTAPFSAKKKKEVIHLLPHHKVLADNFAPTHLTPRIVVAQQLSRKSKSPVQKTKFFTKKHSSDSGLCKQKKASSASRLRISRLSIGGRKKKKSEYEDSSLEMNSITTTPSVLDKTQDTVNLSDEYVRISKKEYESIKNRVSEIETRISHEFENIKGVSICSDLEVTPNASKTEIKDIQSAYERTLEQSEKLNNSSTDELARRLSRDLKIRRSMDSCIIRSPSARKIGTLRRKSKDNSPQLNRHMSLNTADRPRFRNSNFYPSKSLQRGKPNTIFTGLPQPNTITSEIILNQCFSSSMDSSFSKCEHNNKTNYTDLSFGVLTRSQALKKSSLHGSDQASEIALCSSNHIHTAESSTLYNGEWENAEQFLSDMTNTESVEAVTGRPSIAKIRSQNAGMVLAKAKLFDSVIDHDKNNRDLTKKETVENMSMKKMIKPLETTCGNKLPKHHMSSKKSLIEHSESIQSPKDFKDKENKCGEAWLKTNNKSSNLINYCGSVVLPQGLKETIYDVCTPLYVKQRIVPLKDSNRDNNLPNTKKTNTPPIKKPLITPRSTHFSPFLSNESKVRKRPLKASVVITTPRRSPRQIAIKSRQTKC